MNRPLSPHSLTAEQAQIETSALPQGGLLERALRICGAAMGQVESLAGDARRSCNFLRERRLFESRADDIFIVSYPRSGTTWMQFAVYLLVGHHRLDFTHIGQVTPWFERSLAVATSRASDWNHLPGPRIFKSHLTPSWMPARGRQVYLHRDGRDVALSYFHLYRSHLGFAGDFGQFFERFMRGDVQYRGWAAHVRSWQARARKPRAGAKVLMVRYEDMKANPEETLGGVARFLELAVSPARMREILELTSFEEMKRRQAQFDHTTLLLLEKKLLRDQFIRSGRVGEGADALDETRQQAIARAFARAEPPTRSWHLPDFLH